MAGAAKPTKKFRPKAMYLKLTKALNWQTVNKYRKQKLLLSIAIPLIFVLPLAYLLTQSLCQDSSGVVGAGTTTPCLRLKNALTNVLLAKAIFIQLVGLGFGAASKLGMVILCPEFAKEYSTDEAAKRRNLPVKTKHDLADELRKHSKGEYAQDIVDTIRQLAHDLLGADIVDSDDFKQREKTWANNPDLAINDLEKWSISESQTEALTECLKQIAYYQRPRWRIALVFGLTAGLVIIALPILDRAFSYFYALVAANI